MKARGAALLERGLAERKQRLLREPARLSHRERSILPGMPRTVVVTGISGNLGRALAKLLHTETRVVGIDRRPFPGKPKDIEHHQLDLRKATVEEVFRATASARSSTWASCTTRA